MIEVKVQNCNNITSANLNILKDTLNIRYAMNGTGKSTIAKAIELTAKNEDLSVLKTFGSDLEPRCEIDQNLKKVLLFNEDFVNTIVFRESEVIQNAFEIFIKSPEYELRQKSINDRLREVHIDTSEDQDIGRLLSTGQTVLGKFSKTKTNDLKQTGLIKSLTNSESIFKLPEPIKKFQPLMEKDYNVEWVGWKNDGGKYDDNNICPFCTAHLETGYREVTDSGVLKKCNVNLSTCSDLKTGVSNVSQIGSYWAPLKIYLKIDNGLYVYDAGANTLSSSLYTFTGTSNSGLADSSAFYFADDTKILKLPHNSSSVTTLITESSNQLILTDNSLVYTVSLNKTLKAVPKMGGAAITLASVSGASDNISALGGLSGNYVYYGCTERRAHP